MPCAKTDCFLASDTAFTGMTHDPTLLNAIIDPGTHSAFPGIEKVALQPRFGFTWSPLGH